MNLFYQGLVLSFLLLTVSGNFLSDRCSEGPSFWCENLNTAKHCGKVNECKKTLWTTTMQNDEVCTLCKDAVNVLSKYLKANTTNQMIEKDLMKLCSDVPIPELSTKCKQVISEDFEMLYDEIIVLAENSDLICGALGLCSSTFRDHHSVNTLVEQLPGLLKDALDNHQHPRAIVQLMEKDPIVEAPSVTKGDPCKDCATFITDLQGVAKNNKSIIDDITDLAKQQCYQLGPDLSGLCSKAVDQVVPAIVDAISSNDVGTICNTIMMCQSPVGPTTGGDLCNDCVAFTEDWQDIITNNKSIIDQLNSLIAQECSALGSTYEKLCTTLVKDFLPQIWDLVSENDANTICSTLYMCDDAHSSNTSPLVESDQNDVPEPEIAPSATKGDPCKDCATFITDLQGVAKNNKSIIDDITDLVKQQCYQLGPDLSGLCSKAVDQVVPAIVDAISSNDVGTICNTIMMCQSPVGPTTGGDLCNDCVAFTEDWQDIITNNKSIIDQLNSLIAQECSALGSTYEKLCTTLVKDFLPQIWDLVSENDANTICSTLYMCDDAHSSNTSPLVESDQNDVPEPEIAPSATKGDPCKDCATFITDLQGVAKNNKSIIDDITDLVKQQCYQLGPDLSGLCSKAVDQVVPAIVDAISSNDVGTICSTIMMCQGPPVGPTTGGDLCNDCVAFTEDWQDIITNNKSIIDQLNSMIAQECSLLGSTYEKLCTSLVKDFLPQIWDLVSENDANTICSTMYMCDGLNANHPVVPDHTADDTTCSVCQVVVQELENLMKENSSEAAIEAALEKVCSIVPKDIRAECADLVEQYGPDVIDLLINEVKAMDICLKLKLCPSKSAVVVESSTTCDICEAVAKELDNLLEQNSTEEEIIAAVKKVCTILPSGIQGECGDLIDQYGELIIQELLQKVTPDKLCSTIGLCSSYHTSSESSTTCDVCEAVAQELDNLLEKDSTEKEIISAVEKVCGILPDNIQQECKDLIDQYGSVIIQLLIEAVTPDKLCSTIGLCSTQQNPIRSSTTCDICEAVAKELDNLLEQNSTEEEIIAAVKKVCTILPSGIQGECGDLIDQYGELIIQELLQKVTPDKLCSTIGLCSSYRSSTTCDICELVAKELDNLLGQNSTEEEILLAVEKVCTILPGDLTAQCDDFLKQNGPALIQLLINEVSPSKLCSTLGLCSTKHFVRDLSTTCDLCVDIAQELDHLLQENSTEEAIVKAVESVCSLIPDKFQSDCKALIDKYGEQIVKSLIDGVKPEALCSTIGLCSSKPYKAQMPRADSTLCDVCKIAIDFLDQELAANATRDEIEKALETLCVKLPKEIQETCDDIVQQYTPEILELAENALDADYICVHLKLCSSFKKSSLVGHNRCSYGPSYWCKNEQAARECNALDHCRLHVWH